jgi:hypothetical protein
MNQPDSVAVQILRAVATVEGTSPRDVEPPLQDVLDGDAVGRLIGHDGAGSVSVLFEYAGHEVEVTGAGRIYVDGTEWSPTRR